jgi:anaerobic ribonucleoside-triphosphate reductase activating protein
MYYGKIESCSISSGPGCRVTLFASGCEHRCKNCFQPETWCFTYGEEFTEETVSVLLKLAEPSYISGLSLMGGDPVHPKNWPTIKELVKKFKEVYPNKTVWLWTGYLWEEAAEDLLDSGVDVVVDGKFVEELKDLRLKFRGSSNQRIIDVKASTRDIIIMKE